MSSPEIPDFQRLVRERLGELRLDSAQQEEIVAELAGHLQETYEQLRAKGLCKENALQRSLEEDEINWRELSRKIQSAKREEGFMNDRTKQFWLPALVTLTISEGVLLIVSASVGSHPHLTGPIVLYLPWLASLLTMGPRMIYLPWLASLPLAGAVGAYLSRRAGGASTTLLAASLFPVEIGLFFGLAAIVMTMTTGNRIFARPQWLYASMAIAVGVVVPSLALLLGSLPFLKQRSVKV
jgi:hypothetical protein